MEVAATRHLNRNQPHSSPSLSWNGRYLAVIVQRGNRRMVLVEDRLSGRAHPCVCRRAATQSGSAWHRMHGAWPFRPRNGRRWQVEILDLSGVLEPDNPGGLRRSTPMESPP